VTKAELQRLIRKCDSSGTGLINITDFQVLPSAARHSCSPTLLLLLLLLLLVLLPFILFLKRIGQLLLNSVDVKESTKFGPKAQNPIKN
jgi:hypothetical protein